MSKLKQRFRQSLMFDITASGRMLVSATTISVMLTIVKPIYLISASMCCLMGMILFVALIVRPKFRAAGDLPSKIVAGREIKIKYKLTNLRNAPAYDISMMFYPLASSLIETNTNRFIPRIGPGETTQFELYIKALKRGQYQLPYPQGFSTFPFNVFRMCKFDHRTDNLLVLPSFASLEDFEIPVKKLYQPGGVAMASNVGDSPEYIGNREFVPGDSPRRIDPRAWARLGAPVIREYYEEYYCHVALVMDTFVNNKEKPGPKGYPELEAAISLTASVAEAMARGEDIIDVFAAGEELYVFRTGRHTGQFENLLEILACIEHCKNNPFNAVTPALTDELTHISSVIFIMLDWDSDRQKMVRAATEAGCSTRVLIVRDKATTLDYHEAESWAGRIMQLDPKTVASGEIQKL